MPKAKPSEGTENNIEATGAFAANLSNGQKDLLATRRKNAEECERENPLGHVDVLDFEFGPMYPHTDFFGPNEGEPFNFIYGGRRHHIEDLYCVTPSCNCESVILCIYKIEPKKAVQKSIFDILVGFDKRFELKRKRRDLSKKQVKNFFREVIKGNEEFFRTLRTRDANMKRLGAQILARRIEKLEGEGKRIGMNSLCPCGSRKRYGICCAGAVEVLRHEG